jgi:hypothetical protein
VAMLLRPVEHSMKAMWCGIPVQTLVDLWDGSVPERAIPANGADSEELNNASSVGDRQWREQAPH